MDTRKWGSSGWHLLHTISFHYPIKPTNSDKINYLLFFSTVKNILPCKYCRESFEVFTQEIKLINYLDNRDKLSKWLYMVHNLVNDKLRKQGLLNYPNPKYKEVESKYIDSDLKSPLHSPWDFLYCAVFNYPHKKDLTTQMVQSYYTFFDMLNLVLPEGSFKKLYQESYQKYNIKCYLSSRFKLKKWLFKVNCYLNNTLCQKNKNYKAICDKYDGYRAGCSKKSHKGITCRKESKRHTKKNHPNKK